MADRPNVLLILTDQERYPPPYEDEALRRFRRDRLPARERLRAASTELHRHHTASTACQPSRTSIFTGQYPSLHGVTQTNGLAKLAHDPAATYLDPDTVPTMGDWFRAAGYRTYYRGKWHISHADLPFDGHAGLMTNTADGRVDPVAVDAYAKADRLDPFGFSGWIGREPHGPHPADSGFVRDDLFAAEVADLFGRLAAGTGAAGSPHDQPWLAVASLVNPHDIVFSGFAWQAFGFDAPNDAVPAGAPAPTAGEDLSGRPGCQREFRRAWTEMLWEQPADEAHRRFYHWLHEVVDRAVDRILGALASSPFADSTIVVFSSDHGEMLGAHGGQLQKWHNAYDETTRVPFLVSGPGITPGGRVDIPTSHVDLLPTLLGLAGADVERAAAAVAQHHVESHPLVGRDLSAVLRGDEPASGFSAPLFFMSEDDITAGLRQTGVLSGEPFEPVAPPSHVESLLAVIAGSDGESRLWKLNHYYGACPDGDGPDDAHEWELHDLTGDPEERTNRAGDPAAPQAELEQLLEAERREKALRPRFSPAQLGARV